MFVRIEATRLAGKGRYNVKFGVQPSDQRDDGLLATIGLTVTQMKVLQQALNFFIENEQFYTEPGSAMQKQLGD